MKANSILYYALAFTAVFCMASTGWSQKEPVAPTVKKESIRSAADSTKIDFEIGTFITPRDFPQGLFDKNLMNEYYERTARIGSYVGIQSNWFDADKKTLRQMTEDLTRDAKSRGFKFIIQHNLHSRKADTIGTPPSVGGSSFTEPAVRKAYIKEMLHFAGMEPDILFTAVELNNLLFHGNQKEFNAFRSFSRELYETIKSKHPDITISISFQWDLLRLRKEQHVLKDFKDSLDVYSFTSYPTMFGIETVDGIPGGPDYYGGIKKHLPAGARIAMGENGWSSMGDSTESEQSRFYERLPELYAGIDPEFVVITYLHDFPVPEGADKNTLRFSTKGLYKNDGTAKQAATVVEGYYDLAP